MRLLNTDTIDINLQQSCITLVAKIKSEKTLRLRKLDKAYFVPGENYFKSAKMMAGMTSCSAFDLRCIPGTTYGFEDSDNLGIPDLTHRDFKSAYGGLEVVL